MPQVIVTIDEKGNSEIDVKGGQGASCHDLTKAFRNLGKLVEEHNKPEFYDKNATTKVTLGR